MENQNFMLPRGRESSVPSSLARLAHFGHDKRFREDGRAKGSSADGAKIVAPTHPLPTVANQSGKKRSEQTLSRSLGEIAAWKFIYLTAHHLHSVPQTQFLQAVSFAILSDPMPAAVSALLYVI